MSRIKGDVEKLIRRFNTSNIYELCDYLNIHIRKDTLGSTKGYFLNIDGDFFITLNNALEEWEERVVLAHELGHAILHNDTNICFLKNYTYLVGNKYENEANEFAAHLLVSDDCINEFSKGYDYVSVKMLSKHFKIPLELVLYKINCI